MKQSITAEQFYTLSPKAQRRLIEWLQSKGYPTILSANSLPTIGMMLEFLNDQNLFWNVAKTHLESERCPKCNSWVYHNLKKARYLVTCSTIESIQPADIFQYKAEVCDALFEAVREVLERWK